MTRPNPGFGYLRELVLKRSGVLLSDDQEYLVETRLGPIARELEVGSGSQLIETLRGGDDTALERRVVEAMMTGETSWFRDIHPFETLKGVVLPRIIESNRTRRSLSIWSAACSTGQEIYSIAILLDNAFPETSQWDLTLLGTDLSASAIEKARQGTFSGLEVNRGLPATMLGRYFSREGTRFRVCDAIRSRVRFETLNLVRDWIPTATFDIVLLRNVLIYFDIPTKRQVLGDVGARLAPHGALFLGSTETALGISEGLIPLCANGATYYERRD